MGQTKASEIPELDITIAGITRLSSDRVEIRYTLRNKGSIDLYLPYFKIAKSIRITTYSLLHQTNDEVWVSLGPNYDVASYKAKIIKPGEALNLTEQVSDPAMSTYRGPGVPPHRVSVPVRGWHKISVGYYSGVVAWQHRLNTMKDQQVSRSLLRMPNLKVVYSDKFDIPAATK